MPLPTPLPILDRRGRYLRPGLSFSRASAKCVFDAHGTLVTVPANVPAWDCDPLTGAERGLLIEEARTNLLTYSEQFNSDAWSATGLTVSANARIAPDGALTMDKLVENTSTGDHNCRQTIAVSAGTAYTFSGFAAAAERSRICVIVNDAASFTNRAEVYFDLSSGTIVSSAGASGTFPAASAKIRPLADGVHFWSLTVTTGSDTSNATGRVYLVQTGTTTSYTGTNGAGLYLWGAQFEAGRYPTSYVPTGASAVSRQADVPMLMVPGAAVSPNTGTLMVGFLRVAAPGGTGEVAVLSNAAGTHFQRLAMAPAGTLIASTRAAAVDTVSISTAGSVVGTACKAAYAWQADGCAFAVRGVLVGTSEAATMPASVDRLWLGHFNTGNMGQIWIREACLYPRRLPNADIQAMTA